MTTHTLKLPVVLEDKLENLVKETWRTTYLEDRADYIRAAAILEQVESGEMTAKLLREVMAKYDLAN